MRHLVERENACALPGCSIVYDRFMEVMWRAVSRGYVHDLHARFVQNALTFGFDLGFDPARLARRGRILHRPYASALQNADAVADAISKRIDGLKTLCLGEWQNRVHDIPFEAVSFDVVICNHVLEHVDDAHKVMSEFYRVMKKGGWGIFQVPIDINSLTTQEDKSITDPKERERLYWQSDHLRLFGLDYGEKLSKVGFKVTESNFINQLNPDLVERYALPKDEIVYFCEK